jgi:predicted nuclease of predicted toxin-antitoxin system
VKFLLDQSADGRLVAYLSSLGHEVTRVSRDHPPGLPDPEVLGIAYRERRILITHDRHFGGLVFVEQQPHAGVILLRLGTPPPFDLIIGRVSEVLTDHAHELRDFIVVTPDRIRVRR